MFNALRRDLLTFMPTNESYKDNLGLRLEKLNSGIDDPSNQEHAERDAALCVMEKFNLKDEAKQAYTYSFNEWKSTMLAQDNTECFEIKSITKVLLGTGNASVFEFGFNLSKPYGVPYISGSSLKGLVSAYLAKTGNEDWKKSNTNTEKSAYQVQLFGGRYDKSDYIGSVNFYDAKISPNETNWFVKDIITTHYQRYYGDGNNAILPDGTENPIPIKITALDANLKFFVVLQGPEKDRGFIKKVLIEALENDGIGGKTAVGYGRFEYIPDESEKMSTLKELSLEELQSLRTPKTKVGDNVAYDNAIRCALEKNEISESLESKYKKYCPLRYIRMQIEKNDKPSIELIKLDKQAKRNLNQYPNPQKSKDGKFIFDFALNKLKLSPKIINKNTVLKKCAYTWDDVEITETNIDDIILGLEDRPWLLAKDLKIWLENSTLSNKEDALKELNDLYVI